MSLLGVGLALVALAVPAVHASVLLDPVAFETGVRAAQPSVAVDRREGFVVTWQERADEQSLRFAVIDRAGHERRRGTVSNGKDRFINGADFPSLAVLDNGDWITYWLQKTASGTYAYEIRTTRSRDAGRSWDRPVVVHRDATPTEHGFVSMVPEGKDRVRLIWLDGRQMAATANAEGEGGQEHMTLRSAVLGRDGVPREEQELDALTCACCQTDMVRTGEATVAVYRDRTVDELRDIGVAVLEKGRWSAAKRLHADNWHMPGCPVNGPALAAQNQRWLAVWPTMASGEMEVRAIAGSRGKFDAAPIVLAQGADELGRVDVAAVGDQRWLITRVATRAGAAALILATLEANGDRTADREIAPRVGGYPRLAVDGDVGLLAFTVPKGNNESAVGLVLVRAEMSGPDAQATD